MANELVGARSQGSTPTASKPVDVVIVNWNGGREVVAAASSAIRFGGRAIVVDNGSEDGSAELVEREVPGATVLRLGHNAGFARACNIGVSSGSAPAVMLLNPDAAIVEGSARDLLRVFSTPDRPTIVGPKTVARDGTTTRTVRRFPTPSALFLYQLKLRPLARWIPPLRSYLMLSFTGIEAARVDQVIGAAFAMRREDWEHYGGLDERYFLLFEEVDLCRRVARDGRFALFWPGITVSHIGATSFRRLSHVRLQRTWNKSMLTYARLHFGPAAVFALRLTVPVSLVVAAVRDGMGRLRRGTRKSQGGPAR